MKTSSVWKVIGFTEEEGALDAIGKFWISFRWKMSCKAKVHLLVGKLDGFIGSEKEKIAVTGAIK